MAATAKKAATKKKPTPTPQVEEKQNVQNDVQEEKRPEKLMPLDDLLSQLLDHSNACSSRKVDKILNILNGEDPTGVRRILEDVSTRVERIAADKIRDLERQLEDSRKEFGRY